jgi:hypothetical protein
MRGEFRVAWPFTWRSIWLPLSLEDSAPTEFFAELYTALAPCLLPRPTAELLALAMEDSDWVTNELGLIGTEMLGSEAQVVQALEGFFVTCGEFDNRLADRLFDLAQTFIEDFSLRYELHSPFRLCPTLSGIFSNLLVEMGGIATTDPHLSELFQEFEHSVGKLRGDQTSGHLKTVLQKQLNFIEALGSRAPNVTGNTIGRICDQVGTWPHESLKEATKAIYKFGNDYPGVRHSGTGAAANRRFELRDTIAISIALAGLSLYLTDLLPDSKVYGELS